MATADEIVAARADYIAKKAATAAALRKYIDTTYSLSLVSLSLLHYGDQSKDLPGDFAKLDKDRLDNVEFRTGTMNPALKASLESFKQLDSVATEQFHDANNSQIDIYNRTVQEARELKANCDAIKNKLAGSTPPDTSLKDGMAAVGGVPAAGASAIPAMPAVPATATTPAIPAVPAIPAIPSVPAMPAVPAIPAMSGFPATPAIPAMPALPPMPALPSTAFANATASLSSMASIAANLPAEMAATLEASKAELAAKMTAAVATLSRDVGITKALMDMQNKMSFVLTGKPASDEVLNAAAGPTAVLSQGPLQLAQHAADIAKQVSSVASAFGAVLPPGVVVGSAIAAGVAGLAMKAFHSSVPDKTIANPLFNKLLPADPLTNPDTIPNPTYVAFTAIPENAAKLGHLDDMANGLKDMASKATASFTALQDQAKASLDSAIATIKTMSTLSVITSAAPTQITAALNNVVDYTKIEVAKVQNALMAGAPSIPAGPPGPILT